MLRQPPPHGTYAPGWGTRGLLWLSQNTPLGRGKARRLMAAWVRRLNADKLDTELFGQKVRLHMQNNSSEVKALMKPAQYSRAEFAFCRQHLPVNGGVFVDIGANAGLFSLGAAQHMQSGTLIAFEPQPVLFARLKANLADLNPALINRLSVHLFQAAVGAVPGDMSLSVPDQLGQASARHLEGAEQISVPVQTLSNALENVEILNIDLLKVDVEGFEDEVLLPFIENADQRVWPKAIVLEHCHRDRWGRDCEQVLVELGYEVVHKDRTNLMLTWQGR